jgi:hypothetical protein
MNQVQLLSSSAPILQPAITAATLKIVGAEYILATGKVNLLS